MKKPALPTSAALTLSFFDAEKHELSRGHGFLVSKDGRLVTCRHLLHAAARAEATNQRGERFPVLGVLGEDADHDLVLLKIEGNEFPAISIGNTDMLQASEAVTILTTPHAGGVVTAMRDAFAGQDRWLQITAPLLCPSVGVPVLNTRNEVIGILTAIAQQKKSLHFAIAAEAISALVAHCESVHHPQTLAQVRKKTAAHLYNDADFCAALSADLRGDYATALKLAQQVVVRFPRHALAHTLLADTFADLGMLPDAVSAAQEVTKLRPFNGDAWYYLGVICSRLHVMEEEIKAFRQAIHLEPNFPAAWFQLGTTFLELHRYDEARDAFENATKLKPHYPEAWHRLGLSFAGLEKFADAAAAYQHAIKIKAETAIYWFNLAVAQRKQGKLAEAADTFREAVRLQPDLAAAWLDLATTYVRMEKLEESISAYQKFLALRPEDTRTWQELAQVFSNLNKFEEETKVYQEILDREPKNAAGWNQLSAAYRKANKWEAALQASQRATQIKPDFASAWFGLGLILLRLDRREKTEEIIATLESLDPALANELALILRGVPH